MTPALSTRREVIRMVSVGGLAAVAGLTAAGPTGAFAQSSDESDAITALVSFGLVATVTASDEHQIVLSTGSGELLAAPREDARLLSGVAGRQAKPSEFIPGDRVFVQGTPDGPSAVSATGIFSVYQPTTFTVLSVDVAQNVARTSIGTLDLTVLSQVLAELDTCLTRVTDYVG